MNNATAKTVGARVRALREDRSWSPAKLADLLGVSRGMISHYETGRYLMPIDVALRLSKIGKVSLDWLYQNPKRKDK